MMEQKKVNRSCSDLFKALFYHLPERVVQNRENSGLLVFGPAIKLGILRLLSRICINTETIGDCLLGPDDGYSKHL
jgi:hypothetical protein